MIHSLAASPEGEKAAGKSAHCKATCSTLDARVALTVDIQEVTQSYTHSLERVQGTANVVPGQVDGLAGVEVAREVSISRSCFFAGIHRSAPNRLLPTGGVLLHL